MTVFWSFWSFFGRFGRFLVVLVVFWSFWSFFGRFLIVFWSFFGRFLVVYFFVIFPWTLVRIFDSKSCGETRLLAPWSEAVIFLVPSLASVCCATCLFASGCAAVDFRGFAAALFSFTPEFLWCPFVLDRCLEKKGAPTHRFADVLSDQWKDCQVHSEASKRHTEKAQNSTNFSLMTCPPGFFALLVGMFLEGGGRPPQNQCIKTSHLLNRIYGIAKK